MYVCLLTARLPPQRCGVGDYTATLAQNLAARGYRVSIFTGADQATQVSGENLHVANCIPSWGLYGMYCLIRELRADKPELLVIQWEAFLYGKRGINVCLPLATLVLRLLGIRIRIMVHEPWVDFIHWAYLITGPIQRLALGIMVSSSEKTLVSIQAWTSLLRTRFPWKARRIEWVPVGSSIPVSKIAEGELQTLRAHHGIGLESPVLGMFSAHGSAKGFSLLEAAWNELRTAYPSLHLILIGATEDEAIRAMPRLHKDPRCLFTGYLEAADVSHWIQAIDVFLAPFTDGISTRRTSSMAAMAHGAPIVATRGRLTEPLFENSPLSLTDYKTSDFCEAIEALLRDPIARSRKGVATRQFFERNFSWDIISSKMLE